MTSHLDAVAAAVMGVAVFWWIYAGFRRADRDRR
jgi:hypothetical protein